MSEQGPSVWPCVAETADWAAFDKPSGWCFQAEQGQPSLAQRAAQALGLAQVHPVHRLDRGTSGLWLVAKHAAAAAELGQLFQQHQLKKWYWAVAGHQPKQKQGWVVGDMQAARRGQWKLLHRRDDPAISHIISRSLGPGYRAYLVRIETGKTHQVRVALKSWGVPIVGDALYGGPPASRLHLHAYALAFEWRGQAVRLLLPPPATDLFAWGDREGALLAWQEPWALARG